MTFKEFFQLTEDASSTDKGMLGFPVASSVRKPSDGQPFKNLGPVAGQTPRGSAAGSMANSQNAMFMKKRMKKS